MDAHQKALPALGSEGLGRPSVLTTTDEEAALMLTVPLTPTEHGHPGIKGKSNSLMLRVNEDADNDNFMTLQRLPEAGDNRSDLQVGQARPSFLPPPSFTYRLPHTHLSHPYM